MPIITNAKVAIDPITMPAIFPPESPPEVLVSLLEDSCDAPEFSPNTLVEERAELELLANWIGPDAVSSEPGRERLKTPASDAIIVCAVVVVARDAVVDASRDAVEHHVSSWLVAAGALGSLGQLV